jgi:alcohol dehydrogenase class IV
MRFEFATANRVLFGSGTLLEVPPAAIAFGRRIFAVIGSTERSAGLFDLLHQAGLEVLPYPIQGEPSVASVLEGVGTARALQPDLIVGMGGGSALDTAKAIAALMTNPGEIFDYLEVVGKGQTLTHPPIACIAIPTTAGTGAEVTRNAVIFSPDHHLKISLRSQYLLPRLAIVDPELTYSLPPELTASTGMDALTQLIEPFVSNAASPMTDAICREGIRRVSRSLLQACEEPELPQAREDMAIASLFGGMALANARLGAVHGFAGVIGGMYSAPHGAVCACLLPIVMAANIRALKTRAANSASLEHYAEIGRILTGNPLATPEDGAEWVLRLIRTIKIPPLSHHGLDSGAFPNVIAQAKKSSSMKGNPISLTDDELASILEQSEQPF